MALLGAELVHSHLGLFWFTLLVSLFFRIFSSSVELLFILVIFFIFLVCVNEMNQKSGKRRF